MKKIMFLVVLVTMCLGGFLFAQQESPRFTHESDFYYFNLPIERVFVHRLGYVIIYRRAGNHMSRAFIPINWFTDIGGKGEVVYLGPGSEWPSMTVYYREGEFSHVRLRLRRNRGHESWGLIPLNFRMDDQFENIEDIRLEF